MNRLLVILALLFGMAAVAGPAMASAQPHVAMAMAVQAHAGPSDTCAVGELTAPKQLTRPCAKINKVGIALPCHHVPAVLPAAAIDLRDGGPGAPEPDLAPERARYVPGEPQFRPPRPGGFA